MIKYTNILEDIFEPFFSIDDPPIIPLLTLPHTHVPPILPVLKLPDTQKNLFSIESHKRRGKLRLKNGPIIHRSDSFDNLLRKIQVHFLNFLIDFCNDALKTEYENSDYSFKQIKYYKVKQEIKYSYLKNLKHCSIKDILNFDISLKYLNFDRKHNKKLLEKIESSSIWLYNLFQMNYLQLFKYYYNDGKPLNKIYFMEREIFLTPKTKSFYCLLEKNLNLKNEIIGVAKRCYLEEDNNNTKLIQFSHKNISSN